jgi:dihydrodipicolinate synthase/N-acetylneuraminate lyase
MPGRHDRDRLLALELKPGALAGARGLISATGIAAPKVYLDALTAAKGGKRRALIQRAA